MWFHCLRTLYDPIELLVKQVQEGGSIVARKGLLRIGSSVGYEVLSLIFLRFFLRVLIFGVNLEPKHGKT